MKRFTTLMLGTALAAALSFGAQTPAPADGQSSTPAPAAKKHAKKHAKKSTGTPATPNSPAPAKQ